jgi:transcription antitermination factor NusG
LTRYLPVCYKRVRSIAPELLGLVSRWYIARVTGGADFRVEQRLMSAGIMAAALRTEKAVKDRRTKKTTRKAVPLFPGYVFIRTTLAQISSILTSSEVISFLGENMDRATPAVVADDVVNDLIMRERAGEFKSGEPVTVGVGDTVTAEVFGQMLDTRVTKVGNGMARLEAEIGPLRVVLNRAVAGVGAAIPMGEAREV